MLETLILQGKNDSTLLPRVLRVLAQQGKQVESLSCEVQKDRKLVTIEVTVQDAGCLAMTARILQRLVSIETVVVEEFKQKRAM